MSTLRLGSESLIKQSPGSLRNYSPSREADAQTNTDNEVPWLQLSALEQSDVL